ncbi:hypothetical protein GF420_03650 [candidate division GN15 bacterium]|nr:hypothetical protein [candidate division GN15 bacterium]
MRRFKSLEARSKAVFYRLFRSLLKTGHSERIPLDPSGMQRVLFIRPDRIGDTVTSLPLFDCLRKAHPHLKLSILASTKNISLVQHDPRFEHVFLYRRSVMKDIAEIRSIRQVGFDCVVDLLADDSVTCLFLTQLCGPVAARLGVRKRRFAQYYDYTFHPGDDSDLHMIDINLHMLEAFGITERASGYATPYVDRETAERTDRYFESIRTPDISFMVGINLSQRGPNRFWGMEKWEQLTRRILDRYPEALVVLITAPPDRERGDKLETKFSARVVQVEPNLDLTGISAVLSRLDILISPDTSLVHIARSFKVPVVGFYPEYKGIYRQWSPYGQPEGLVLSPGEDNIFRITVDQAIATFERLVEKNQLVAP